MRLLFVVLAAACCVGVNCGEILDDSESGSAGEKAIQKCTEQLKVTEAWVKDLLNSSDSSSATPEQKNFVNCIVKNIGWVNEDGSLTKAFLDNPRSARCKDLVVGKDLDDTADKVTQCIIKV